MPEAIQPRTVNVDGYEYTITPLDAYAAVPVFQKCARVIVPALDQLGIGGAALASMVGTLSSDATEFGAIARVAMRFGAVLVKELDAAELRHCIDAFAAATTVNLGAKSPGLRGVFAEHFRGRLVSMTKWFGYCLEVNFGDFFDLGRATMSLLAAPKRESSAAAPATASSPSPSPGTSTG